MDTIATLLATSSLEYEFLFHDKQLYSAAEGAAFFGIEVGQTAPTLIVQTENGYFSIVFSGSRPRLDFKNIAALLKVPKLKLADRSTVQAVSGFSPGDTPMIGLQLPNIFDKKLLQYPFVYGGSGLPNRTLKIAPAAIVQLNQPVAFLENDD